VACKSATALSEKAPSIAMLAGAAVRAQAATPRRDRKLPQVESAKGSRSHQGDRPNALDDRRRITQPHKDVDPERGIVCLSGLQPRKQASQWRSTSPRNTAKPSRRPANPSRLSKARVRQSTTRRSLVLPKSAAACLAIESQSGSCAGTTALPICCSGLPCTRRSSSQKRKIVLKVSPAGSRGGDRLQEGLDPAGENHARLIGSRGRRLREKVRGGRDGAIRADSFHQMVP